MIHLFPFKNDSYIPPMTFFCRNLTIFILRYKMLQLKMVPDFMKWSKHIVNCLIYLWMYQNHLNKTKTQSSIRRKNIQSISILCCLKIRAFFHPLDPGTRKPLCDIDKPYLGDLKFLSS